MYEAFYKLTGRPFQLSPDPAFFYGSRGHRRAAAYLEYGVEQGEGFIVITGEVGAGKTTLVRNLLANLPATHVIAAQLVSTQLSADDMPGAVCAAFNLAFQANKAVCLYTLHKHLRNAQHAGKRCLLIVDEAQNLSAPALEELRMLSNFQTERGSLLQSFLVGQPEFRQTFTGGAMQQLRQRVIATYHLGPLELEETRAYIEHRLGRVGWDNDPSFSDAAHEALHSYTAGLPRRINTVCDRLLLMASLDERHHIDAPAVAAVVDELEGDFTAGAAPATPEETKLSEAPTTDLPLAEDINRLERYAAQTAALSRRILDHIRGNR